MAISKVLPRLLRLRELEEELSRLELESSVGKRNRVAQEFAYVHASQNQSRDLFASALERGDAVERRGATLELDEVLNRRMRVEELLVEAESEVERRRDEFLLRRTNRRQVETLVEQQAAAVREETSRRAQQMLDDWYGRKAHRASLDRFKE